MRLENRLHDIKAISDMVQLSSVALDIVTSLCGEHIGSGAYRDVYNYNLDDNYVVKIEHGDTQENIVEYLMWYEIQGLCGDLAFVKDWFAPVKWLSPNGKILVMKKVKSIPSRKKPKKIPEFLWDVKEENFGWLGNKFVCIDYGQFHNFIHYSKKMRKVIW